MTHQYKWQPEKIMTISSLHEFERHFPNAVIVARDVFSQLVLIQQTHGKPKPLFGKHPTQKAMSRFSVLFVHFIAVCRNDNLFGWRKGYHATLRGRPPRKDWEREEDLVEAMLRKYSEFNPETTPQLQLYWIFTDAGLIRQLFMKAFPPG